MEILDDHINEEVSIQTPLGKFFFIGEAFFYIIFGLLVAVRCANNNEWAYSHFSSIKREMALAGFLFSFMFVVKIFLAPWLLKFKTLLPKVRNAILVGWAGQMLAMLFFCVASFNYLFLSPSLNDDKLFQDAGIGTIVLGGVLIVIAAILLRYLKTLRLPSNIR